MNTFKRKLLSVAALVGVVTIAGCAGDQELAKKQADVQVANANVRLEEAKAAAAEAKAVTALADKLDSGGATAYLLAKALKGLNLGSPAPQPASVLAPQPHWAVQLLTGGLQFAKDAALGLAPVVGQVLMSRTNAHTQEVVAGYNRDTTLGAYSAFTTMGGQIAAGHGPITTTTTTTNATTTNTNTLSGTGVIGSGTFNPITRTCSGGTGAAGGAGSATGTTGGSGGAASGGAC